MAFRRILVVDDEESIRHVLTLLLSEAGYEVRAVADGNRALAELEAHPPDLVITDVRMPGLDGLALLAAIRERSPSTLVVVMSAYGTREDALAAVKAGAYDYLSKPFRPDEVVLTLRKAEERERLVHENRRLRAEVEQQQGLGALHGSSPAFQQLLKLVRRVAEVKTTTLVLGESGTGKELVARALHDLSPRRDGPFLAVNCGAIPETLIESELFGHVKGAFTDARTHRKGLFEEADGGTLFLDEIGELPLSMQVKLLRVLQEEEVRRVGDSRDVRVDVRVVAATVRDLPTEVREGRFREDLWYRLNVVQLKLPPLRERPGDIPVLVRHFVEKYRTKLGRGPKDVSPAALRSLEKHEWPGNVRELENVIERAMVLAEGSVLEPDDLPERFHSERLHPERSPAKGLATSSGDASTGTGSTSSIDPSDFSIKRAVRAVEADMIRRALAKTGGNRTRAAELLELSHRALLYKLKDYGIR